MNPFEAFLIQLAEQASAEFLSALAATLAKKLNKTPAPVAPAA